jgi:hypothetical protein
LFAEIADAFYERDMFVEAKPIYEQLGGDPAVSSNMIDTNLLFIIIIFARQAASISSCERLHVCAM